MKVIILGSGFLGATTAYFLSKQGVDVTVVDRQSDSAMECSYANGGQLSYSHAEPWANEGTIQKSVKWIGKDDAPLKFGFSTDPHMWSWTFKFLNQCNVKSARKNSISMMRIGLFSRQVMHEIIAEEDIEFSYSSNGIIHVFFDEKEMKSAISQSEFQKEKANIPFNILNPNQVVEYEKSLEHKRNQIVGGIVYPLDELGCINQFSTEISKISAKKYGANFEYNTNILDIKTDGKNIVGIETDKGTLQADKYVMAMGSYSYIFLKKIGIKVPIYPMKGYSISVPITNMDAAPNMSITDASLKVVFCRLGNVLRAAGTAEFAGYNDDIDKKRIQMLKHAVSDRFPDVGNVDAATEWACLRPSTPDGPPIIGSTSKYNNLFLNTGHGTLGWTQGAGSAKIVASLMLNNDPLMDLKGLTIDRY